MQIAVLGGGPGGLYLATLWKRRHPGDRVILIEQNPAGATFGFGVVFSDKALEFLRADDPATADLFAGRMAHWRDMTLVHRGQRIVLDGIGFAAIGRLELLTLLTEQARAAGVVIEHGRTVTDLADLAGADLVVGADGVNSLVRRTHAAAFGATLGALDNMFAWYGTTQRFDTLTQTFIETPAGPFNAHHYRYSETMSTFIIECSRATWLRAGFDQMSETAGLALGEQLFAETLDGHKLIANKSIWRQFPTLWTERWVHRNFALIGDAAHTAHFSVGSGTRLALEDAIALVKALEAHPRELAAGLAAYDATRRPIAKKIVDAALTSARWYEDFGTHMRLQPYPFALSYITRSGRIDRARLATVSPRFLQAYEAAEGALGT